MPRKIRNWQHMEHHTDCFEFYKAVKYYAGVYGEESVKVIENSYLEHFYADVYVREGAVPVRECVAMFGSALTFRDKKTGQLFGDRIWVRKVTS